MGNKDSAPVIECLHLPLPMGDMYQRIGGKEVKRASIIISRPRPNHFAYLNLPIVIVEIISEYAPILCFVDPPMLSKGISLEDLRVTLHDLLDHPVSIRSVVQLINRRGWITILERFSEDEMKKRDKEGDSKETEGGGTGEDEGKSVEEAGEERKTKAVEEDVRGNIERKTKEAIDGTTKKLDEEIEGYFKMDMTVIRLGRIFTSLFASLNCDDPDSYLSLGGVLVADVRMLPTPRVEIPGDEAWLSRVQPYCIRESMGDSWSYVEFVKCLVDYCTPETFSAVMRNTIPLEDWGRAGMATAQKVLIKKGKKVCGHLDALMKVNENLFLEVLDSQTPDGGGRHSRHAMALCYGTGARLRHCVIRSLDEWNVWSNQRLVDMVNCYVDVYLTIYLGEESRGASGKRKGLAISLPERIIWRYEGGEEISIYGILWIINEKWPVMWLGARSALEDRMRREGHLYGWKKDSDGKDTKCDHGILCGIENPCPNIVVENIKSLISRGKEWVESRTTSGTPSARVY